MACVLSDDEDSDNGAPPHRSGVLTAIASPCKLSMPSTLTSVASLVKDGEPNEWIVRAGDDVSKFLYANGPGRIVRYNFRQVRGTRVERRLVERSSTSAGLDFSDIFALTGEGQRASSSLLGFKFQLACTGKSMHNKAPPNCRRLCCGGYGFCQPACEVEGGAWLTQLRSPLKPFPYSTLPVLYSCCPHAPSYAPPATH